MEQIYIPTGNEFISLPQINEKNAVVETLTFLHMGFKGLVEIRGGDKGIIQPLIMEAGKICSFEEISWDRKNYWIPSFVAKTKNFLLEGIILTPIGERGFVYRLTCKNISNQTQEAKLGLSGEFESIWHCINENKQIEANVYAYNSVWNDNFVLDYRNGVGIFSIAPMVSKKNESDFIKKDNKLDYNILCPFELAPDESFSADFYWGIGFEEVSAATSAKEMLRQEYEYLFEKTMKWLEKRITCFSDTYITEIYNINLFFNIFYATGQTLDTEELVLVTSRSPRYYVSAAYWDRDSLLWSFPSILQVDAEYAKNMLEYVFTKQIKNAGIHSRFIDGVVLEPGFELDELCAPLLALCNYLEKTKDYDFIKEPYVLKGVKHILKILADKRHPQIAMYETFLQPTDDMHVYRYLTYNNVLVWKMLNDINRHFKGILTEEILSSLKTEAEEIKLAILKYCVHNIDGKETFIWSTDLNSHYDIYDEPPGSLQLLPFYGFCNSEYEVFLNTLSIIRSPEYRYSFADCPIAETGCAHAPHPWILSVANSLLLGRKEHCRKILEKVQLDNKIACESVDEYTGKCTTGAAFATCAGFLSFAIYTAFVQEG